jgi:hypothetical protein
MIYYEQIFWAYSRAWSAYVKHIMFTIKVLRT